jgi:AcrR family transcriptional regulator
MVKSSSTEQKIIDAARKVFVKKGMAGARMQEIADEAGINKALLHYYFRSKEKLFDRIFLEAFKTVSFGVGSTFSGKGTVLEKLKKFIDLYMDVLMNNQYLPVFVLGELNHNPERLQKIIEQNITSIMESFFAEIVKEINNGTIKPMHPVHIILNIMGMLILPFIARPLVAPIIKESLNLDFDQIIQERKIEVYNFVVEAILAKDEK